MDSEKEKTMKNCKRGKHAKYFPVVKIKLAQYWSAWHNGNLNLARKADAFELEHVIAYK